MTRVEHRGPSYSTATIYDWSTMTVMASRTPVPTRLDSDDIAALDELVDAGVASNRAEAIRLSIRHLHDALRRERIGDQIVAGYLAVPLTPQELAVAEARGRAMIEAEPWPEYQVEPQPDA